jgi:hypothetical protein
MRFILASKTNNVYRGPIDRNKIATLGQAALTPGIYFSERTISAGWVDCKQDLLRKRHFFNLGLKFARLDPGEADTILISLQLPKAVED